MIRMIAALDRRRGIGKHDIQPWYIPVDEQYFTRQTRQYDGNVLVGGVTFRSSLLGRPLAGRPTYLLTHDSTPIAGVELVHDLGAFLRQFTAQQDLWVIGGANVFEQVLALNLADELYLTHIDADFGCDRFFPAYDETHTLAQQGDPQEQNGFHFNFSVYKRKGSA